MTFWSIIPVWLVVVLVFVLFIALMVRASSSINVLYYIRHNFFYIFIGILVLFITISVFKIQSSHDLDLSTGDGFVKLIQVYFSWMGNVLRNVGKVTGYAVQQDWFSANSTNQTGNLTK